MMHAFAVKVLTRNHSELLASLMLNLTFNNRNFVLSSKHSRIEVCKAYRSQCI